jgi:cell division initiation protein
MALTPYEIHNKEFKRSFRGYDIDQVNDFLDQIIKDFELLTREKLELEQQVEDVQAELERVMEGEAMYPPAMPSHPAAAQKGMPLQRYGQHEPGYASQPSAAALPIQINQMIRVAQEVAEELRLHAKKEAELIVQEAEKNADRIINEALQKARMIHSEMLDLKQKATVYRARFRTLVQSHLDILENSDWESLEELEDNLEERGKQMEQYAEPVPMPVPDLLLEHQPTQEFKYSNMPPMEEANALDEVAASYMEEEDEPRRELRRTSRKLKKKAMY